MKMRTQALAAGIAAIVVAGGMTTAAQAAAPTAANATQDVAVGSPVTLSNQVSLSGGKTCEIQTALQTGTPVNALSFTVPVTSDSVTSNENASLAGTDYFTITCKDMTPGGKTYTTNWTVNVLDASATTVSTPDAYYALAAGTATLTAAVTPAGASGNAVTWSVDNTATPSANCSIADATVGTVTYTAVGTCAVTATAAAGNSFFGSSDSETLTVKGATTTSVSVSPTHSSTYFLVEDSGTAAAAITSSVDFGNATPTYSVDGSATNSANCSIDTTNTNRVDFTAAGICTVVATYGDSTDYYLGSSNSTTVEVHSTPTLSLTGTTVRLAAGDATNTATLSLGSPSAGSGALTYALVGAGSANCSLAGDVLTYTAVGTCQVTAHAAANGYYEETAESAPVTITVDHALTTYVVTITGYAPKGKKALAVRRATVARNYLVGLGLTDGANVTVEYVSGSKTVAGTGTSTRRTVVSVTWSGATSGSISRTIYFKTSSSSLTGKTGLPAFGRAQLKAIYVGTDL